MSQELSRRKVLGISGSSITALLAGCSGDGDGNDDGNVSEDNGNGEVDLGIGLEITGDNVFTYEGSTYQDGPAVATEDPAIVNCDLPEEFEKAEVSVLGESADIECGDTVVLDEEGEYTLSLGVLGESGELEQAETTYAVIAPASIETSRIPEEVTAGEEVTLVYNVTGTNVQANHNITMPEGGITASGEQFNLTPEEAGQIEIESTAENTLGIEQIVEELEVTENLEDLQQKNLEKRKEVAGRVPEAYTSVSFYDTEIFRRLLPESKWNYEPDYDRSSNPPIHPKLSYFVTGAFPTASKGKIKSFEEIEGEDPSELYFDSDWRSMEDYRGCEMYVNEISDQFWVGIDRNDNFVFGGRKFEETETEEIEVLIDMWKDGLSEWEHNPEDTSFLDSRWHQDERKYESLVLAESKGPLYINQIDPDDSLFAVQTVDKSNNEVTEEHYQLTPAEREWDLIDEKEGIPLSYLVDEFGKNVSYSI